MTFSTISKATKSTVLLSLALFATSALASPNKQTLQLNHPTAVNGTTLKAGEYKLQWDGTGPNVEVSIMQGKNVVAKVPARVVELPSKSDIDAAVTKPGNGGTSELAGARFQGKTFALEIGESGGDTSAAGSSK